MVATLTFDEYDYFGRTRGRELPGDEGWRRGRRPVINVSWEDAKAYVEWLSSETEKSYRLLSEAEWEYACRAGTTTRYWWPWLSPEYANYGDTDIRKTSEVGKYAPNPWGLYDMHGNVREWVEDCWNESYDAAPDDGSAWTSGDCSSRVLRGGCWDDGAENLGAWARFADNPRYRNIVGFRVARTLSRSESVTP